MSQAKAASDALDLAVLQYKRHKSLLQKSLNATTKNERSISNKMKSLADTLQQINLCYHSWVSKSGLNDEQLSAPDQKYSSSWLEGLWSDADDLQEQVDNVLDTLHPPTNTGTQQLEIIKGQFDSMKIDITSRFNVLLTKTDPNTQILNSSSLKVYESLFAELRNLFSVELQTLTTSMSTLDQANSATYYDDLEQFKRTHQSKLMTVQLQLADQLNTPPVSTVSRPSKGIEMEKGKAPTFSGTTTDYPEFKHGWQAVPGVHWDDANQVEQIKYKVDSETRCIITRCSTMQEVWDALDAEFAQEQEVVNAVDSELKTLRLMDCSVPEYIVKLKNHLPNLEKALKSVDGFDHLSSPARVEYLASKFDTMTLKDWDYFKAHHKGSTYDRFVAFLEDQYNACKSSIARSKATVLVPPQMSNDGAVHHVSASAANECRRCQKWLARDKPYACPACGRGTPVNEKIPHCLEHCAVYISMSLKDRSDCIEHSKWCPVHMVGSHAYADCNMKNDAKYVCGINSCTKHHHNSLHGASTPFVQSVHSTQVADDSVADPQSVLLSMQTISTSEGTIDCLFDNCATCCLITEPAAKRLNLTGEPIRLELKTVNDVKIIESVLYNIPLLDNNNEKHSVKVWQVDSISDGSQNVDVSAVKHLFSSEVQEQWDSIESRPSGPIDILLGANCLGLHPVDLEIKDNMRVLSSPLDPGLILVGSHPSIRSVGLKLSEEASSIMYCSRASVNKVSVRPVYEYLECDDMGVEPPRRCGKCRKCKDCAFMGRMLSQLAQYESQVMESKIVYDAVAKVFRVKYPFTQDPQCLPENRGQVIKIAQREENRLLRTGLLDSFNQEFDKMLQHGALEEIFEDELSRWAGPKHYVSLQHVINEDSATTPLRIVTNSSLSDRKGLSLNSILMKGHESLSDQWDVLTRWRTYETALCTDVTKAYYTIKTGELEKHVRMVVWRYGDQTKPWRVFGFCTVSFGDKPAATFLEIAIRRTAEMNQQIDPVAAARIRDDRYVDDISTGGTPAEVVRFMANEDQNFQCDGTIPSILAESSLSLKVMVPSGETNPQKIAKLGGKILGLYWDALSDELSFRFLVTLITKDKTPLAITPDNYSTFDRDLLTPSNLIHIINKIYDPMGLGALITISLRIAFRHVFKAHPEIGWDVPLPPGPDRNKWLKLIHLLLHSKPITFQRCIKPANTVAACQLICFFDGSDDAFAAVIYIRWELADGSVYVTLECAKPRVTPLKGMSTPRAELNGAVIAVRLALSAVRSLTSAGIQIACIWFIGDSECTLSSLEKINGPFGEYFGNRVGEVQDTQAQIERLCPVGENGEWWYTRSCNNAADPATRPDATPSDIDVDSSPWQLGPSYLKGPRSSWPIDRDFATRKDECIPQNELLKQFRCMIQVTEAQPSPGIEQIIDPFRTNNWNKLLRLTQFMLTWFHKTRVADSNAGLVLKQAKKLWFLSAMPATVEAMKAGRLRALDVQNIDGVIQGRATTPQECRNFSDRIPCLSLWLQLGLHTSSCLTHTARIILVGMLPLPCPARMHG